MLYRGYVHFSRSIQLEVWGEEGAVNLPADLGQSPGGGQGCKAPKNYENSAFCSTKKRPKTLVWCVFSAFKTIIQMCHI